MSTCDPTSNKKRNDRHDSRYYIRLSQDKFEFHIYTQHQVTTFDRTWNRSSYSSPWMR